MSEIIDAKYIALQYTKEQVWQTFNINKKYTPVRFCDGYVCDMFYKDVIYNYYIWQLYRLCPDVPILYEHTVTKYLEETHYNADTHIFLLEQNFKHIVKILNIKTYDQKEPLLKLCYEIVNMIYNDIVFNVGEYVTTIDALDFIEVVELDEIKKIHSGLTSSPASIEDAYNKIAKTLKSINDTENMFIHAYKSKTVNQNQANQCIGPRGFVTDVDRTVYKQPIMSGFIRGLNTIYEVAAESRTAAKAHRANDTQIAKSEYISRRLQLLSMYATKVIYGDCGSQEYMDVLVTKGSIRNFAGKYYLDDNNNLKVIKGDEKDLEDKILRIRTIFGCKLENPHHVCSTCLGDISTTFENNSNIGNLVVMYVMEKLSQAVLSTKHLSHSVKAGEIYFEPQTAKYFYVNKENNLYLQKDVDTRGLSIVLPSKDVPKLIDVINLTHNRISVEKIGNLSQVFFVNETKNKSVKDRVSVMYNDRYCNITQEFLSYIKNNIVLSDVRGNFVINLDHWDKSKPMFNMPMKEDNLINFVSNVASIVESEIKRIKSAHEKADTLFTFLSKKLDINFSIVEIITYATSVYNKAIQDYRLPRGSVHMTAEKAKTISYGRSLSHLFSLQEQIEPIFAGNGDIFDPTNREDHPMDIFFDPQGVIEEYMRQHQ
jgi:hypothetical protein